MPHAALLNEAAQVSIGARWRTGGVANGVATRCTPWSLPPDRAEGAARPGRATGTARSVRPGLGVWGAGSQRPLTHSPCPAQRSTAGPCRLPPGGHGGVLSLDASGRARPAARIGMRGRRVILTAAATGEGKTGAADNEKEGWLAG